MGRPVEDDRIIEQLRQRIDALERTASLGLLLSAIVHEVNNPLSVILIGADTMRRKGEGSASVNRHVDMLEQQSEKIMDLNGRLQELSRWNLGQTRDVDARDLVGTFADLEAWIEGEARRPILQLPDDPLIVSVEPELATQVLRFLARSVRTAAGGDDIELTLSRQTIPLIELPTRRQSPTRDFAVFRLVVGAPQEPAVAFTEWLGDFFERPPARRALELMACWEVVRKSGGRLRVADDEHGAEAQLMFPVDRPKRG